MSQYLLLLVEIDMTVKKLIFVCLSLVLIACEQQGRPMLDELPENATILAFGDSLTYGTGAARDSAYPAILSELSALEVINAGKPGEISQHGLKRLPGLLDRHQPDLLVLIHGGNDLLRKIPEQKTYSNLEQMIEAARERQIDVVMLGVPKPSLLLESADFYHEIAERHQLPIDTEILAEILGDNDLKHDTIHPNTAGYQKMAEAIFALMTDAGAL